MRYNDCITLEETEITEDTLVYIVPSEEKFVVFAMERLALLEIQGSSKVEPSTRAPKGWELSFNALIKERRYPRLFNDQGFLDTKSYTLEELKEIGIPELKKLKKVYFNAERPAIDPVLILKRVGKLTDDRESGIAKLSVPAQNKLGQAFLALREKNLLTEKNIDLAIKKEGWRLLFPALKTNNLLDTSVLEKLYPQREITQIYRGLIGFDDGHFDMELLTKLLKKPKYAESISLGLRALKQTGIDTDENFAVLCKHGPNALDIGYNFSALYGVNLLNEKNRKTILDNPTASKRLSRILSLIKEMDLLNQEVFNDLVKFSRKSTAILIELRRLLYDVSFVQMNVSLVNCPFPKELEPLISSIDKMFSYGVVTLANDKKKGRRAMKLALSLKGQLKEFLDNPPEVRKEKLPLFIREFKTLLTSKNDKIGPEPKGRREWDNIVATILFALLSSLVSLLEFGLTLSPVNLVVPAACFALAARHLYRNSFFIEPNRQKVVKEITDEFSTIDKLIECKMN